MCLQMVKINFSQCVPFLFSRHSWAVPWLVTRLPFLILTIVLWPSLPPPFQPGLLDLIWIVPCRMTSFALVLPVRATHNFCSLVGKKRSYGTQKRTLHQICSVSIPSFPQYCFLQLKHFLFFFSRHPSRIFSNYSKMNVKGILERQLPTSLPYFIFSCAFFYFYFLLCSVLNSVPGVQCTLLVRIAKLRARACHVIVNCGTLRLPWGMDQSLQFQHGLQDTHLYSGAVAQLALLTVKRESVQGVVLDT